MASTMAGVGSALKSKYVLLLVFQVILIVLYAVFVRYDVTDVKGAPEKVSASKYAMFQDVHVMIFVGFGFLMTFLKRYGYSALGFNWLLGAIVIQWALLCQSFYHMVDGKIRITLLSLIEADIMAATVLISFGALLGRTTGPQLMVMSVIETAVSCANLYLVTDVLKAADCGGSIAIHTFGAYFGLTVSMMMRPKKTNHIGDQNATEDNSLEGPSYSSDITAMIGSIFLWIFWPSFNAALLESDDEKYRAIINTYLSLAAAALTAFAASSLVSHERKLDMVHAQNATLAGGVAAGSVCNMMLQPGGALAAGAGAGLLSVLGYRYLTPKLQSLIGLKDTCGVHNLHGMPGVYSGLLSAVLAALAAPAAYGAGLYSVFPAMAPQKPEGAPIDVGAIYGDGRSAQTQALYQFIAVVATMAIAIFSGLITGRLITLPVFEKLSAEERYNDNKNWELPSVEQVDSNNKVSEQTVELEPTKCPSVTIN